MRQVFHRFLQQSQAVGSSPAPLAAGQVRRLCTARPGVLRVAQGRAWVTLGQGPYHAGRSAEVTGDFVLHAGQSVAVPAGSVVVLEAAGTEGLHYRLQAASKSAGRSPVLHWWQRAQVGPYGDEMCCA